MIVKGRWLHGLNTIYQLNLTKLIFGDLLKICGWPNLIGKLKPQYYTKRGMKLDDSYAHKMVEACCTILVLKYGLIGLAAWVQRIALIQGGGTPLYTVL